MRICNLMTGVGWGSDFLGELAFAWLGMVILFFLIVLARKWMGEEMGLAFSSIGGFVGGYGAYIIAATFLCSFRWAMVAGVLGFIVGAYLIGMFTGGEY